MTAPDLKWTLHKAKNRLIYDKSPADKRGFYLIQKQSAFYRLQKASKISIAAIIGYTADNHRQV
jgi:hypothetical protein